MIIKNQSQIFMKPCLNWTLSWLAVHLNNLLLFYQFSNGYIDFEHRRKKAYYAPLYRMKWKKERKSIIPKRKRKSFFKDYRIQAHIRAIRDPQLHIIKDIYTDLDAEGLLLIWKKHFYSWRLLVMRLDLSFVRRAIYCWWILIFCTMTQWKKWREGPIKVISIPNGLVVS